MARAQMEQLELGVTPLQRADLGSRLAGNAVKLAIINLMLTDPTPQRLGGHPQPLGHRRDCRSLTRVVIAMLRTRRTALARVSGSYLLATKCTFRRMEVRIKRGRVRFRLGLLALVGCFLGRVASNGVSCLTAGLAEEMGEVNVCQL